MGSNVPQIEFFHNNLISVYSIMGDIPIARKVFDEMPYKNIVSYNTMIGAYSRLGNDGEACNLFSEMRNLGFSPTQFTYSSLFSCNSLDAEQGLCLQAVAMKSGLLSADAFVGTSLLGLYGRQGYLSEAYWVFDEMPFKNLVTWNAMISLFGHEGFADECMSMFCQLTRTRMTLSESSFVGVLTGFQSAEDVESGEQLHGLAIKYGLISRNALANSFLKMYGKCANTCVAEKMFNMVPNRDTVSWNTIIGIFAKGEQPIKALDFFCKMYEDGFLPNETTFLSTLSSCTRLVNLTYGEFIHAKIIKNQFENNVLVGSSLVYLYAKWDKLDSAHRCFDEIHNKNLISWNALILGYSNKGSSTSISMLQRMIHSGIPPNEFTFSSVVKSLLPLEIKQVHSLVVKTGYHNEYVTSALMTSYAKIGLVVDALSFYENTKTPVSVVHTNVIAGVYNRIGEYHKTQEIFSELKDPDIISWNILIAACSRNKDYNEAFELFQHMLLDKIPPDNYTYVSLISICTNLCNLILGASLHSLITKTNYNRCDIMVRNVMIDMYAKCGNLKSSVMIFKEMEDKNVISWTALVSALGLHGHAQEALKRFREMEMSGVKPDKVAFMAALSACRHVGLVTEGMELFEEMKVKYAIEPQMEHYLIVVDLMSKYGDLKEAERLITGMPFPPNVSIWRSFLDGCNRQRIVESCR